MKTILIKYTAIFLLIGLFGFRISMIYQNTDERESRALKKRLFSGFIPEPDSLKRWVKINNLNVIRPASFESLLSATGEPARVDENALSQYHHYFKMITDLWPQHADAHSLLGYTQFYSGDLQAAKESYQKSVYLQPDFFWTNFNLAVITHTLNSPREAIVYLERTLQIDPGKSFSIIENSPRLYTQSILEQGLTSNKQIIEQMKQAQGEIYQMLAVNYWRIKDFKNSGLIAKRTMQLYSAAPSGFKFFQGAAAFDKKDYESALKSFKEALDSGFYYSEVFEYIAKIGTLLQNEETVLKSLETAARLKESGQTIEQWAGGIRLRMY